MPAAKHMHRGPESHPHLEETCMKHALPRPSAGDDNGGRPWPVLAGDREPKRWVVIVDDKAPVNGKPGKGGGR